MRKILLFAFALLLAVGVRGEDVRIHYDVGEWKEGQTYLIKDPSQAIDGWYYHVISGTAKERFRLQLASGVHVIFSNLTIDITPDSEADVHWPAVECLGSAYIELEGANTVKSWCGDYSAIYWPKDHYLIINANLNKDAETGKWTYRGSLKAQAWQFAAAIGACRNKDCGNLVITGEVEAKGGTIGAGIGGAYGSSCGNIEIEGGSVRAIGGTCAAGIGTGGTASTNCGNISIIKGRNTEMPSTVYAKGGSRGAGIGTGWNGKCGNITIDKYSTIETHKGLEAAASIGNGLISASGFGCGTVTVGGVVYPDGCDKSPYFYPEVNLIDLAKVDGSFTAQDGDILTGKLSENVQINVAANATIHLRDVNIPEMPSDNAIPGLNCLGNANIYLDGSNIIYGRSGNSYNTASCGAGIFVAKGSNLHIYGDGSLEVYGAHGSAGIGSGRKVDGGSVVIYGGKVLAKGGTGAAGVGSGSHSSCGAIEIFGGKVKARGSLGIGAGYDQGSCAYINIQGGEVEATGVYRAAAIGAAEFGHCGDITIGKQAKITAVKGNEAPKTIGHAFKDYGAGKHDPESTCGTITIGGAVYPYGVDKSPYYYPETHLINLADVNGDFTVQNGDTLTGKLASKDIKITVEDGAHIALFNAEIDGVTAEHAGITCLGNAEIILVGDNYIYGRVTSGHPAIFVPEGYHLSIIGGGNLNAHGGSQAAAAIGSGKHSGNAGDISFALGSNNKIVLTGGANAPAIGAAGNTKCGNISIVGGEIIAYGGENAPGIGSGGYPNTACGNILIEANTYRETQVYACGNGYAPGIGAATGTCGTITIKEGVSQVTAVAGDDAQCSVGTGMEGSHCGVVTIGGVVYQFGVFARKLIFPSDKVIDIASLTGEYTLQDGYTLTGTAESDVIINIEENARVTLRDVQMPIFELDVEKQPRHARINCLGDAEIRIDGSNQIKGYKFYPAVYVPSGKSLILMGEGSLKAEGGRYAAAIGGGYDYNDYEHLIKINAGNIIIQSGTIVAYGGESAAGIGSGYRSNCGDIHISAGTVKAYGHNGGAGIGSADNGTCGNITLAGGTIYAGTHEEHVGGGAGIGSGWNGKCGWIALGANIQYLKATRGENSPYSVGKGGGKNASCGLIMKGTEFYANNIDRSPFIFPNEHLIDLDAIETDFTAMNNDILTGTLKNSVRISIADNATVILQDATIGPMNGFTDGAGITCLGNASIVFRGMNNVKSLGDAQSPAIYVPENKTLYLSGTGTLRANAFGNGAAIGAGVGRSCGHIVIENGTIEAFTELPNGTTADYGAAIGGSQDAHFGSITINGGTIIARGSYGSAAIGGSRNGRGADKNPPITINGGTIYAYGGVGAPAIGAGMEGCVVGDIVIKDAVRFLRAEKGASSPYSIGSAKRTDSKLTKTGKIIIGNIAVGGITQDVFLFPWEKEREAALIKLDTVTSDLMLVSGDTITGTLSSTVMLSTRGGVITLRGVDIKGYSSNNSGWAGITCLGNTKLSLEGENAIRSFSSYFPPIYIAEGATLTMTGNGSLQANGDLTPAIGAGYEIPCGNIVLQAGSYELEGGSDAPAIGGAYNANCGRIDIRTGVYVKATRQDYASCTVGAGTSASCDGVYVGGKSMGNITTNPYIFPEPTEVNQNKVIDLSQISKSTTSIVVQDGYTITGTLDHPCKINLAPGVIKLYNAFIAQSSTTIACAGLTCTGNTTLYIYGSENQINGIHADYPAIFVPEGSTLTIRRGSWDMSCSLSVESSNAAAIGASRVANAGNIIIESGYITADGGTSSAAIGGTYYKDCGNISILGGYIDADGGHDGPGIGSGAWGKCGTIEIGESITSLLSKTGSGSAKHSIGCGRSGKCDGVIIAGGKVAGIQQASFYYYPGRYFLYYINDGETLTGDYSRFKLMLHSNESVILENMTQNGVNSSAYNFAGITCMGNGHITLKGENSITGFCEAFPGIEVGPENTTLTIDGDGSLDVKSNGDAPAIGPSRFSRIEGRSGNIVINGGTIHAVGGDGSAAIGGSMTNTGNCGDITINGGTIYAKGGMYSAGIGAGRASCCGNITLGSGITRLEAVAGEVGKGSPRIGGIATREIGVSISSYNGATPGEITFDGKSYEGAELYQYNPFVYPANMGVKLRYVSDGEMLFGEDLDNYTALIIEPDAVVGLLSVNIGNDESNNVILPGIFCKGNAHIYYSGDNVVGSFDTRAPGIYVPKGDTLYLKAWVAGATLDARCQGTVVQQAMVRKEGVRYVAVDSNPMMAPGIGGFSAEDMPADCGSIIIESGNLNVTGGAGCPGIGSSVLGSCDAISILGGIVEAYGGIGAPGLGAGSSGNVGQIDIANTVTRVLSQAGINAPYSVGAAEAEALLGLLSSCEGINVGLEEYIQGILDQLFIYEPFDGDLSKVNSNITVPSGAVLFNTLEGQSQLYKISIADGATVTLRDAAIKGYDEWVCQWAGLTCEGDATIILEGENFVQGFNFYFPAIFVPEGHTLTIKGDGSLTAKSGGWAAGIGAGWDNRHAGNIIIEGGSIYAEGGSLAAGIGGAADANCGDITICSGATWVMATKGPDFGMEGDETPCSLGRGGRGSQCGVITIADVEYPEFTIDVFEYPFPQSGPEEGIEMIMPTDNSSLKVLRDGQLFILRGGKIYTVTGQVVK